MSRLEETKPGSATPPPPQKSPVKVGMWTVLASLPALACAAGMVVALTIGANLPLVASYTKEANLLRNTKDYPARLVCLRRLSYLEPGSDQHRFELALVLSAMDKWQEAEEIMRSIAPPERKGVPEAHLWLARQIMSNPSRFVRQSSELEAHLLRVLEKAPESGEAKLRLGLLYAMTGRPLEARPRLEATAGKHPDRLLDLAHVCERLGDNTACSSYAKEVLSLARHRAEAQPTEQFPRILWAEACLLLRDFPGVITAIETSKPKDDEEGQPKDSEKSKPKDKAPDLRKLAAEVCAKRVETLSSLARIDKTKADDELAIIRLGLHFDGSNAKLLGQLGGFLRQGGAEGEEARALLLARAESKPVVGDTYPNRGPSLANFVLGCDAWTREKVDEAREHWEKAYRLDPDTPTLTNNLAWLLAYYKPVDLKRAITLIDHQIKLAPTSAEAHGTRGQILVKMGKYKEGAREIESALAAGLKSQGLLDALSVAYEHLDKPAPNAGPKKPTGGN